MSAVDILIRAEELLYEERWSPNSKRGPNGPRCVFWALADAMASDKWAGFDAYSTFLDAIGGRTHTDDIFTWNDAPGRTVSEVMDAFTRAIALAKEREAA